MKSLRSHILHAHRRSHRKKAGAPPGTLVHVGPQRAGRPRIHLIDYDEQHLEERELANIEECRAWRERPSVTWINIDGLHDVGLIEEVGRCFDIHPLVLEDILNTEHRPKIEDYHDYIFCILKMLSWDEASDSLQGEQVSLILGPDFVLSFQEEPERDVFDPVRARLREQKGRIRSRGADYLAYALVDAIVDNYYAAVEKMEERILTLEDDLILRPEPPVLDRLRAFQRDVTYIRRSALPLPAVLAWLQRLESPLLSQELGFFLRDVHDHTVQIVDSVEGFRDSVFNLFDLYVSAVSHKLNEVMKVLTVIATIFIPLTFIAGVYGMNFEYMPELKWKWSYPLLWGIMLLIAGSMVIYFKKKKWF